MSQARGRARCAICTRLGPQVLDDQLSLLLRAFRKQIAVQIDSARRVDVDVEDLRLEAGRFDFDLVRSDVERQTLKDAVEVVDDARVVAVDIDGRVTRPDLETNVAVVPSAAVDRRGHRVPVDSPVVR